MGGKSAYQKLDSRVGVQSRNPEFEPTVGGQSWNHERELIMKTGNQGRPDSETIIEGEKH